MVASEMAATPRMSAIASGSLEWWDIGFLRIVFILFSLFSLFVKNNRGTLEQEPLKGDRNDMQGRGTGALSLSRSAVRQV